MRLARSRTNSTPTIRPGPRTSPIRSSSAMIRPRPAVSSTPRAAAFSTRPSSRIVRSTASAAAQATGLPPYVEPWAPRPQRVCSSREVTIADSGNPLATAFAMHTTSGTIPACSNAHIRPVRPKPVWISSAMRRMPCSSQKARRPRRNAAGAGV